MSHPAVAVARNWIGTPFVEGGSLRGVGADCAGLLEGVARELGLAVPERGGDLLAGASAMLVYSPHPQPFSPLRGERGVDRIVGSVILLAKTPGGIPEHCALVTNESTLIHAHWRVGVVENRFGAWFARRVTHAFDWPNLTQNNQGT